MTMDNLKEIDEKFDNYLLSNSTIYILDNSTIFAYENYQFNFSGIINGDKPQTNLINKDLVLLINDETDEEKKAKELNCTVIDIINNNYTLSCRTTDENNYDLQSAISIIEDGILLINFDINSKQNSSKLSLEEESQTKSSRFYNNKSNGISAGSIVAIILASLVALASIIGITVYCKKRPNKITSNESTVKSLQNIN